MKPQQKIDWELFAREQERQLQLRCCNTSREVYVDLEEYRLAGYTEPEIWQMLERKKEEQDEYKELEEKFWSTTQHEEEKEKEKMKFDFSAKFTKRLEEGYYMASTYDIEIAEDSESVTFVFYLKPYGRDAEEVREVRQRYSRLFYDRLFDNLCKWFAEFNPESPEDVFALCLEHDIVLQCTHNGDFTNLYPMAKHPRTAIEKKSNFTSFRQMIGK